MAFHKEVQFPGFASVFSQFPLSAAVVLPANANAKHIVTSGHVGLGPDGQPAQGLSEQVKAAFEVGPLLLKGT